MLATFLAQLQPAISKSTSRFSRPCWVGQQSATRGRHCITPGRFPSGVTHVVWGVQKEAQQGDIVLPCRFTPILRGVREEVKEGAYTLVLEFETKKDMTMDMWTDRVDKIETFFGPGIKAKVCFSSHLLRGLVDFRCLDCSPAAAHPAARHAVLA